MNKERVVEFRFFSEELKRYIFSGDNLGEFFDHSIYNFIGKLEQFTGGLDAEGKKIYEGDILCYDEYQYVVYYNDEDFCYSVEEYGCSHIQSKDLRDLDLQFCNIIGNINENIPY